MASETIRVVIADDHQMVRETWKIILDRHEQIDVIGECSNGAEAIDSAIHLNPDVILMDINMYPVNGFEATRKILKQSPNIKIIGVSVNNQPGYARNMLQLGAKGYVTKNSTRDEMIHAIMQVTDGKTYVCREVKEKMG
ncbi:MAG TPA: response regulator transcription factor [Flavisolibacter sp.]|jgi:DNA-binding NarL/FixJ family response regulator|nr:response regulator transcription factor [Flavisolibacter sp.]